MVNGAGEGQRIRKWIQVVAVALGGLVGSAAAAAGGLQAGVSICPEPNQKYALQTVIVRTAQRVVVARDCPLLTYQVAGNAGRVEFGCPVAQATSTPQPGPPVAGGSTTVAITPEAYFTQCALAAIEREQCFGVGTVERVWLDCADENLSPAASR